MMIAFVKRCPSPRKPLFAALLIVVLPSLPCFSEDSNDPAWRRTVGKFCLECHGAEASKAKLNLESILSDNPALHAPVWENVVRRLRTRQMPPAGKKRPTEGDYVEMLSGLDAALDAAAAAKPDPGRTDTIRRLTRSSSQPSRAFVKPRLSRGGGGGRRRRGGRRRGREYGGSSSS